MGHFEKPESYIPVDLLTGQGLLIAFFVVYAFILFRYFLMVAPFYFFFRNKNNNIPTQNLSELSPQQIRSEINYSMISSVIFAVAGVFLGVLCQLGYSQIYFRFDEFGYWYLPVSFILLALIHEVYFYVTHRLMHQRSVFRIIHKVHHDSKNVSPWASFSFHPYEATILALFLPLITMVLPLHPLVLIAYVVFMTITAISNHLGHELVKSQILLKYFISGTHHSLHHRFYNYNYGLYFRFMDVLFRTEYTKR